MNDNKLLPCPFCGGVHLAAVISPVTEWAYVKCLNCKARGPGCEGLDQARATWNDRNGEPTTTADAV